MDVLEKLDVIRKTIEACYKNGRCLDCPFYIQGDFLGKCTGHKEIGRRLLLYADDIKKELENGKKREKT